jgi:hypothetical protein
MRLTDSEKKETHFPKLSRNKIVERAYMLKDTVKSNDFLRLVS